MNATPATFETGNTYSTRSMCDYETVFSFTVAKRTAKFITITNRFGETRRVGVSTDSNGNEYSLPLGTYSMCPIIRA